MIINSLHVSVNIGAIPESLPDPCKEQYYNQYDSHNQEEMLKFWWLQIYNQKCIFQNFSRKKILTAVQNGRGDVSWHAPAG